MVPCPFLYVNPVPGADCSSQTTPIDAVSLPISWLSLRQDRRISVCHTCRRRNVQCDGQLPGMLCVAGWHATVSDGQHATVSDGAQAATFVRRPSYDAAVTAFDSRGQTLGRIANRLQLQCIVHGHRPTPN